MNQLEELVAEFQANSIPYDKPGFYDLDSFLKQEKRNPLYLSKYAEYVLKKEYQADYINYVRRAVPDLAAYLYGVLNRDGRKGACIDLSMAFSRMLDKLGIWNYCAKGALTITFDSALAIPPTHFQPWMAKDNPALDGHVWIVAPPYKIIDLTVKHQPYANDESKYVPNYVLTESTETAEWGITDIVEPAARIEFLQQFGRKISKNDILIYGHFYKHFIDRFGVAEIAINNAKFKYICTGTGASEADLEGITIIELNGKSFYQIFQEFSPQT